MTSYVYMDDVIIHWYNVGLGEKFFGEPPMKNFGEPPQEKFVGVTPLPMKNFGEPRHPKKESQYI